MAQRAINPQTGKVVELRGNKWVELTTAKNSNGDILVHGDNGWEPLHLKSSKQGSSTPNLLTQSSEGNPLSGIMATLPTQRQKELTSKSMRLARGAMDPVNAVSQMAYKAMPQGMQNVSDKIDNWLYQHTNGLLGSTIPFNQRLNQEEQAYHAARRAVGQNGIDWMRVGGNVGATLPMLLAGPETAATTLRARLLQGAGVGAGLGTLNPVYGNNNDFLMEKGKQALMGAGIGAAGSAVGAGIGRIIRPNTSPEVQTLMREGVTPTPGQILGGPLKAAEEKFRSMPITGDMIAYGQRKGLDQLNRAAYGRALSPIGKSAKNLPVGREGVASVKRSLSQAYNNILPKLTFRADKQFADEINKIHSMIPEVSDAASKKFHQIVKNKLFNKMMPYWRMSGHKFKIVETDLGRVARKMAGSQDFDTSEVGNALNEVLKSMRLSLERSNPSYAKELSNINKGYANYAVIRKAGSMAGTEGGFTPSQLAAASRMLDKSIGKGSTATGKAMMQDLTDAGKSVLANTYPDSGTAGRNLWNLMAMGSGYISPAIPAGLIAGGLPYLPPFEKAIATILTKRPDMALPIANAVRKISPLIGVQFMPNQSQQ